MKITDSQSIPFVRVCVCVYTLDTVYANPNKKQMKRKRLLIGNKQAQSLLRLFISKNKQVTHFQNKKYLNSFNDTPRLLKKNKKKKTAYIF